MATTGVAITAARREVAGRLNRVNASARHADAFPSAEITPTGAVEEWLDTAVETGWQDDPTGARFFVRTYMTRRRYLRTAEKRLIYTSYLPVKPNLYLHGARIAWNRGRTKGQEPKSRGKRTRRESGSEGSRRASPGSKRGDAGHGGRRPGPHRDGP